VVEATPGFRDKSSGVTLNLSRSLSGSDLGRLLGCVFSLFIR
jgi:hypothetical protein